MPSSYGLIKSLKEGIESVEKKREKHKANSFLRDLMRRKKKVGEKKVQERSIWTNENLVLAESVDSSSQK